VAFIEEAYEPAYYWWEVLEGLRKLLVTTLAVFFMDGSASQILATLLVALVFLLALRSYNPYLGDDDDVLAACAQVGLMLTSLSALCLKVNVTTDDAWSEEAFDVILGLLLLTIPAFAVVEFVLGYVPASLSRPRARDSHPARY